MVSAKAVTRVISISQNISKCYVMGQFGHQNDMHDNKGGNEFTDVTKSLRHVVRSNLI